MKKVFVVMGESGEYEDRKEWPARVLLDKGKAEAFAERALEEARATAEKMMPFRSELGGVVRRRAVVHEHNANHSLADRTVQGDIDTYVDYYVVEVEFDE